MLQINLEFTKDYIKILEKNEFVQLYKNKIKNFSKKLDCIICLEKKHVYFFIA